jgi:proton-dependent oligopeptide transporter, POT family
LRFGFILATLAAMKTDVIDPAALPSSVPDPKAPIPRQIRYIIGNEGCERFSFYGMRNILTMFLAT